jgi:DNA-directed RNA polymerase III subunit RPC1
VLNSDFSAQAAAQCMNRLAKLSARFIGDRGFSIGIDDVTPAPALQRAKEHLMEAGCALSASSCICQLTSLPSWQTSD